jgi:uncharacterized protein YjbI with pentapeptide repeats
MNIDEFKRILTTFADNPANVDVSKGQLVIEVHDDVIGAELINKGGALYVREDDAELPAHQWLINRVARLPQLADRILSYVPEEPFFVTPSGELSDRLEESNIDEQKHVGDSVECIREVLGRRPVGTSSVLYLTSDAGEGKTTLINQVAHVQARAYKDKKTDWLLIPITLGGRPFLRFDDIVVGSLVNRLRFPFYYYDSFLELVRMGVLVPAFDGFEEMFIESSSGEALSALGNLLRNLESSGSVLISARKAYFEYKSFANQAKLFDAIRSDSASFSGLALNRWNQNQFLDYSHKRGIPDGQTIYQEVSKRFQPDHPLLTRAVLVQRLLDVAADATGRLTLLDKLGQAPHDYFFEFVNAIIEREVREKWIDRSGQPAQPLITVSEHHDLLSFIAQEMWLVNSDLIKDDALDVIADIFSEIHGKSPVISRQIKERIKQHALLTSANTNRSMFAFDHEEFRSFFLGQAVGRRMCENSESDLRGLLRTGPLSNQTFDAAVQVLKLNKYDFAKAIRSLQNFSQADTISSFTRENCGGLIVRLLDDRAWKNQSISSVSFPPGSLENRTITGVSFCQCYFQSSSMVNTAFSGCRFESCRFDSLELSRTMKIHETTLSACDVINVIPISHENRVFDPESVQILLRNAGFTIDTPTVEPRRDSLQEPDDEMLLLDRALRYFIRSTHISENILKVRLGAKANVFFKNVMPFLLKSKVLFEIQDTGGGNQRRFRLNAQMREIDDAMAHSNGSFDRFLSHFESR